MTARKTVRRLHPVLRASVRDELVALRGQHGTLSRPVVSEKAAELGVAERTIWRLAQDLDGDGQPAGRRAPFTLDKSHLTVIAASPNLRAAWSELRDAGGNVPGYVQWTRACRQVDPAVLAGLTHGREALHEKQAYLLVESEHRNAIWCIDHYYVPVRCQWRGYRNPVTPVQTTIMDDRTRTVIATVLWPKPPTDEESAAVVAKAVRGFTAGNGEFVGGVPARLRMDRGAELVGSVMTERLLALRVNPDPVRPRAGWEKGKLERWHETLGRECWALEAAWTGGPKNYDRKPMLTIADGNLPTDDMLRKHLASWVEHYNETRTHDGLGGKTPLQAWTEDRTPLRLCPDELLRLAMLTVTRKVRKEGVRFGDEPYTHPQLTNNRDRDITVAYLPDEPSFVDVELPDGWVRAKRHADLTAAEQDELMRLRADQERQVTSVTRAARAARAARSADRDPDPDASVEVAAEDKPLGRAARRKLGSVPALPVDGLGTHVGITDLLATQSVRRGDSQS